MFEEWNERINERWKSKIIIIIIIIKLSEISQEKRECRRKNKSPIEFEYTAPEAETPSDPIYNFQASSLLAAEGGPLHTAEGQENQGYNRQLEGKKPQWVFSHRINLTVVGHNLIGAESWIPHRWAGSRPPPDSQGEVSQVYPPGRTWPVQRKGSKNWQNVNWEAGRQESKR